MSAPTDFEAIWSTLPLRARLCVVNLVGEQVALGQGIDRELEPIAHSWHAVDELAIGTTLIMGDAFKQLTGGNEPAAPPGFIDALVGLLAEPSDDGPTRTFLTRCDPGDVATAIAVVGDAVAHRTDLTPPSVLRSEFNRRRR